MRRRALWLAGGVQSAPRPFGSRGESRRRRRPFGSQGSPGGAASLWLAGTVSDVPEIQQDKAVLRARLLAARSGLSADQRRDAGRLIRDALLDLPALQMAGTVAAYYSVGAEPDTRGLVYALWKRGTYVLLPLLRSDGDLDWASYEGPDSLVPGPRGLREPGEPPRGIEAVARADAVLAPALAVDRAGRRLGRGGGSYDRVLARVGPLIPLIALLYDAELLGHVPAERHDVPVRAVVRPGSGITWLPTG
jgi:5-formyltetrahydrofolate cyclo-ligase